ncbi:hypothetical protein METBIDRAFT_228136 [Metschnikowia bicuspidata var. bicuspidata NRRL YB-4993]|uniref:Alpha-type protein kinase domain-containing protein n=1 Tax=Metschnikowia bicuspidata var. bicuspidata NRRL YB-4993 TaxID=869754 RepID=A0A1A0HFX1_9ASCO|nr:hypothetical protein METBIDRAFT_228136 [Metschnikowia bicuspidata var. bicuspidata NRRL YB-4993]OBA22753.1 hypothetical protein METBIDRAFT_228136 [Metschnikowia bicuspidata var. bicuspidata NRRL YB-4993]
MTAEQYEKNFEHSSYTPIENKGVDEFFKEQKKIHREACNNLCQYQIEVHQLLELQKLNRAPLESTKKERAEYSKTELEVRIAKAKKNIEDISKLVFLTKLVIEWCQEWIENRQGRSYKSPEHMYSQLPKTYKEVVDYFVLECVKFYKEDAIQNLASISKRRQSAMHK